MAPIMQLRQMMPVALLLNHPGLVSGVNLKKAMAVADAVDDPVGGSTFTDGGSTFSDVVLPPQAVYLWLENSGCVDTSGNDFDSWYNDNGRGTLEDCEASCNQYASCLGYELWDGKCYSNRFNDTMRPETYDPSNFFLNSSDGAGVAPMSGLSMTSERPRQDCYVKFTRDVTDIGSSPVITRNGTVIEQKPIYAGPSYGVGYGRSLYIWLNGSGCTDRNGNDFDSWYNDQGNGTPAGCEASCNKYNTCLGYELYEGRCFSNRFSDGTRNYTIDPSGFFQKHWDAGVGVAPMSNVSLTPYNETYDCFVKLTKDVTPPPPGSVIVYNGVPVDGYPVGYDGPVGEGYPVDEYDGPVKGVYSVDGPWHPKQGTWHPDLGDMYGGVQVTGDPHVTTFRQKHFDLHYRGTVKLLELTSVALPQEVLLQVNGTTGGSTPCGAQYLKEILVTGQWTQGKKHDFRANRRKADPTSKHHKARMTFGPGISFVVSHGVTDTGVVYLNLRTSSLAVAGVHVGGLLGDEDFSWAARVPEECH